MLGGDGAAAADGVEPDVLAARHAGRVHTATRSGWASSSTIPDRYAVRVPMQWTRGRNGGFSTAPPAQLVRPLPGGAFAPAKVNVADQRRDPDSLLRFVRHLIRRAARGARARLGHARR